jgi:hypothetical protein
LLFVDPNSGTEWWSVMLAGVLLIGTITFKISGFLAAHWVLFADVDRDTISSQVLDAFFAAT